MDFFLLLFVVCLGGFLGGVCCCFVCVVLFGVRGVCCCFVGVL